MMRLFAAVNFSDDTKAHLLSLRDTLKERSARGNFTQPRNIHLTLAFLGDCDAAQAVTAKAAMDAVCFKKFEITIGSIGRFRRGRGDLWWAGVDSNEFLSEMQNDLSKRLTAAGFDLDIRRYSPHVTIGREVVTDAEPWNIGPFAETVNAIDLMMSERIDGKLTYTAIHTKKAEG